MALGWFNVIHLAPLFIIGVFSAYTDLRYKKIFNKWLLGGAVSVVLVYGFLYLYNAFLVNRPENVQYLIKAVTNGSIGFGISYVLWYFRLWSGGDAKLFSLYCFLVPLDFYSKSYMPYFPSFGLLANLFLPLLLLFTLIVIGKTVMRVASGEIDVKKKVRQFSYEDTKRLVLEILQMYFSFLFIMSMFQLVGKMPEGWTSFALLKNQYFLFAIIIFLRILIDKAQRKKPWIGWGVNILVGGFLLTLLYLGKFSLLFSILKTALVIMVIIGFLQRLLRTYIEKYETVYKEVKKLEEGDILTAHGIDLVTKKARDEEKQEELGRVNAGGLTENQIEVIHNLFRKKLSLTLGVYTTFPFAPFMLAASLVTITFSSSVVVLLNQFIEKVI